jgi:hypothetical protein
MGCCSFPGRLPYPNYLYGQAPNAMSPQGQSDPNANPYTEQSVAPIAQQQGGAGPQYPAMPRPQQRPMPPQQPVQPQPQQQHPNLESIKQQSYNEIMAHEQAHANQLGGYGGSIHIDYDSNGIAVGGHVPVTFPALTPDNPDEALRGAQMIYRGALAPSNPSSQDVAVASRAQAIIGQAQVLINQKQMRLQAQQSNVSIQVGPAFP